MIACGGEAAVRIARALTDAGYIPVGVYTSEHKNSYHRRYLIEDAEISDYNDKEELFDIAEELAAEAIHPCYGELKYSPEFSREVARRGLIFIGPPSNTLELLVNRKMLLELFEKIGLKTLPRVITSSVDEAWDFAKKSAGRIFLRPTLFDNYSLLEKVSASDEKKFRDIFEELVDKFRKNVRDNNVIVELAPRELKVIEVQLLGDGANIIHLYERKILLWRGFQKIVAEAPSPDLQADIRYNILNQAVKIAESLSLKNIASLVFLVSNDGEIFVWDVIPGLTPEHSVNEMITAVDIVRKQVEIALYGILDLRQDHVLARGHSIQANVYAESPLGKGEVKSIVQSYYEPNGPGVRVDSAVAKGMKVDSSINPLAKIVVWGYNRQLALSRMRRSISELYIGGVPSNLLFTKRIFDTKIFEEGVYDSELDPNTEDIVRDAMIEELRLHAVIALFVSSKARLGFKTVKTAGPSPFPQDQYKQTKRSAWYYYMLLKDTLSRRRGV